MKEKKRRSIAVAIGFLFFLGGGALSAVEPGPQAPVKAVPDFAHLSIGSGYGLNYGGIGLGFEFNPALPAKFGTAFHQYISLAMGCGYMPNGGIAYSFGLHVYPLGRRLFLQPRFSVQYGVVAVAADSYSGDESRSEGVAFGAGFLAGLARRFFFDADIHVIIPVDYTMDELEGGRVRFSAGLRYRL
jgi:hypothetical protein